MSSPFCPPLNTNSPLSTITARTLLLRAMDYTPCGNCGEEIDTGAIYQDNSGIEVYWASQVGKELVCADKNTSTRWFCEWACLLAGVLDDNVGDYDISEARGNNTAPHYVTDDHELCAHCGESLVAEDGVVYQHVVAVSHWHIGLCWRHFCSLPCLKYGRRLYEHGLANDADPEEIEGNFKGGNAFYTDTPASEAGESDMDEDEEYDPIAENDEYDEQAAIDKVITKLCLLPPITDPQDMHTLDHYGFAPDSAVKVK